MAVMNGGHVDTVRGIDWQYDRQRIYSCGEDARMCLWSIASESEPASAPTTVYATTMNGPTTTSSSGIAHSNNGKSNGAKNSGKGEAKSNEALKGHNGKQVMTQQMN
jgi:hypothetical protein